MQAVEMDKKKGTLQKIYTPLGAGQVVHTFPDGTFAVEFDWGGGSVFRPGEALLPSSAGTPNRRAGSFLLRREELKLHDSGVHD